MSSTIYAFLVFTLVATLSPGGATTIATASGIQYGYRRSLPLILGIATALAGLAAAGALGMGILIASMPILNLTLKGLGTAYLLWLASRIWRAGAPQDRVLQEQKPFGFLNGILVTLLNPKGWAMTMAAAVTFAPMAAEATELATIMALTFAHAAVFSLSLWCLAGALISRKLKEERHWQLANRFLATLLALCIAPLWIS